MHSVIKCFKNFSSMTIRKKDITLGFLVQIATCVDLVQSIIYTEPDWTNISVYVHALDLLNLISKYLEHIVHMCASDII